MFFLSQHKNDENHHFWSSFSLWMMVTLQHFQRQPMFFLFCATKQLPFPMARICCNMFHQPKHATFVALWAIMNKNTEQVETKTCWGKIFHACVVSCSRNLLSRHSIHHGHGLHSNQNCVSSQHSCNGCELELT